MAFLTQYSSNVPVIKFLIDQTKMTIGQHIDTDICVPEDSIADNHACLNVVKEQDLFRFLINSAENGKQMELNGQLVSQAELKNGDWLLLGEVEFQFTDDGVNEINKSTAQVNLHSLKKSPQEINVTTANAEIEGSFSRRLSLV